jgi:hypothetical protein
MTGTVAGIDPHQDTFTVGLVDHNGVELATATFPNRGSGYIDAVDLLAMHRVELVGVEGTASWGQHVAIALAAAGLDVREVPAQRSAQQRRARRRAKTDAVDAVSAAPALLAEPTLGPAQALELYDPLIAKIEAVLEHRRALVEARTLMLHYAQDQLGQAPHRDPRPAPHHRQDRVPAPQARHHRHHRRVQPGRRLPTLLVAAAHRPGPRRTPADPAARTPDRRTARCPRHQLA